MAAIGCWLAWAMEPQIVFYRNRLCKVWVVRNFHSEALGTKEEVGGWVGTMSARIYGVSRGLQHNTHCSALFSLG